jgi:hypothetical protein
MTITHEGATEQTRQIVHHHWHISPAGSSRALTAARPPGQPARRPDPANRHRSARGPAGQLPREARESQVPNGKAGVCQPHDHLEV